MIVEQRTYDFYPGKLPEFFRLYDQTGAREVQAQVLGNLLGYFTTEIGPQHQTVHLWGYASLDDRMARRRALMEDAVWREFLAQILPLLIRQDTKVLLPTPFSPIGGTV
ncbi:NIPSNAP family protein [Rhodobacteraceae bacterium CCMM004]|nr:NIPSNAP family protein [Rhodobacteraceae bacterium CCMM004]